ncbi:hypothetical protein CGRA01v4_06532 [Colletotrichum graminicola]|nr:hypothetical protein CGRA01v4_06532 [Colletotrichum graminicola]
MTMKPTGYDPRSHTPARRPHLWLPVKCQCTFGSMPVI